MRALVTLLVCVGTAAAAVVITTACADGAGTNTTGITKHAVYLRLECGKCHGHALEGARTAPPLTGLSSWWDEAGLLEYLRSPEEVTRANPRVAMRNEQYPLKMPSFASVEEAELVDLTRFLLEQ
jgi:cytochrome c553